MEKATAWARMKKEELYDACKGRGLDVNKDMLRPQLIEMLTAEFGDAPDPESLFVPPENFSGGTVRMSLPADKDNPRPVKVLVNGKRWDIKRDQVVDVPIEVARVLRDAKETHFRDTGKRTSEGNVDYEEYEVPRFPMQAVLDDMRV
ncbi:MAG: hypothetical protein K2W80_14115 [Burkholderiales bacterium]|nr:hypothetical protein [Burkholderiales bacterium]